MGNVQINNEFVNKYKVDDTILESYFKNAKGMSVTGMTFPLRIDNRQYCSPTDYQGKKPSCCGYSTAQILESLNWMRTGKIVQFDADQIYAKAKQTDKQMDKGGTYPDLAMQKGLDLVPELGARYQVQTSNSKNVDELKRALHKSMFVCVNMVVTNDIYNLDTKNFVYEGTGERAGGHSLVCCGYDEEAKMLIMQNHWGTIWGMKGFFLCPYDVWKRQNNIFCWYEEKVDEKAKPKRVSEQKKEQPKQEQKDEPKQETKTEQQKKEEPAKEQPLQKPQETAQSETKK